jgi:hypothetical protein
MSERQIRIQIAIYADQIIELIKNGKVSIEGTDKQCYYEATVEIELEERGL